ncbi:MAG: biotin/lipoyl-binding protein [Deltaproteobacteria bacterium]|jgi:propionyl-CoA carboxylase alpha chain|nr:biotin/lipoyl-binding protein [Deltaproteobacteria bacterium]
MINNNPKKLIAFDINSTKEIELSLIADNKYIFTPKKDEKVIDIKLSGSLEEQEDVNQEYQVEFSQTDDGFTMMTVNGTSYPVEILANRQNEYELLVNGVGYSFSIETPFSMQRKKMLLAQAKESPVMQLKAPIPGTVVEVLVQAGDVVKSGDTLLVLEAMKMQNAILANIKGRIRKIYVKQGDSVSQRDLLIEIERE